MSFNAFVVGSGGAVLDTSGQCRAVLGYKNLLPTSILSATVAEDASYPLSLAFDYKTNTEYSPSTASGSVVITVTQSVASNVSYFGLFSKNAGSCGLSFDIEIRDATTGTWGAAVSRGSFANGKPQMIYFDPVSSLQQRITIYYTSKAFIATLSLGDAVLFDRTPTSGYQPARNASIDDVSQFSTDGNNFVQGRRLQRGYSEQATVNHQTYSWVDSWWAGFMNHVLDSKPVFFMANSNDQSNCVFGLQDHKKLIKPSYENSTRCEGVRLDINGWAG